MNMVVTEAYSGGLPGTSDPQDPSYLHLGGAGAIVLGDNGLTIETHGSEHPKDSSLLHEASDSKPIWPFSACFPSSSRHPHTEYMHLNSHDPDHPTRNQTIPYYNILWADIRTDMLTIKYLTPSSKDSLKISTYTAPIPEPSIPSAEIWTSTLLERAYGTSLQRKRIKVLINPFGGKGTAAKLYSTIIAPIFAAAHCIIDVQHTTHSKHAEEIARDLDTSQWDVIACCSGDGIPHEVFNGLAKQKHAQKALRSIAVTQLPCGSGNAMSWNAYGTGSPSIAALGVIKGIPMPMDLVSITQGTTRTLSFLSQAVGIIAESDLATENWRWMGDTRFTLGYIIRLMRLTVWPVDIALGIEHASKEDVKLSYRNYVESATADAKLLASPRTSSTVDDSDEELDLPALRFGTVKDPLPETWKLTPFPNMGSFYAGNMAYMSANNPVFPASVPADGLQDLLLVPGDIARKRALELADAVGKGELLDADEVQYVKVCGYRITPREKEGYISIDGERFPFEGFQAEVHRGLGCTLSKNGRLYEAKGPKE